MIKALVFDFDGVILDSAVIKTEAYSSMFKDQEPWIARRFMAYHCENMGYSRRKKFEYYFTEILKTPIPEGAIDQLSAIYKKKVVDQILSAPFIHGMPEFLDSAGEKWPLFIATGTPQEEIEYILDARGLRGCFAGVYGTPAVKEDILQGILWALDLKHGEVVFFGDAESDRVAAEKTKIPFIAIKGPGVEMMRAVRFQVKDFEDPSLQQILCDIDEGGCGQSVSN